MDQISETSEHSCYSLQGRLSTLTRDWYNLVSGCEREDEGERSTAAEKATKKQMLFCTDSKYTGPMDTLGFSGNGTYTYPHGVKYEGNFFDGRFEGEGSLIYPNGYKVLGTWKKGKMVRQRFFFEDGLEVTRPWTYLDFPDRMMHGEGEKYFKYAEDAFQSVSIDNECYDTGDGIYDPHTKCVHDKYLRIIRIVTPQEERQITTSFRARIGGHVGYKPEFYECWTAGQKDDGESVGRRQKTDKSSSELTLLDGRPGRKSV